MKSDGLNIFRLNIVAVIILMAYAILTRFTGVGWGFPYLYHDDEWQVVFRSMLIAETMDLNPHFFHYPGLLFYLQAALFNAFAFIRNLGNPELAFNAIPQWQFFFIARLLSATFGVGSIWLTYSIGRRCLNQTAGIIGAGLLTTSFVHNQHSHYGVTDVPLTFFTTLTLYCSILLLTKRNFMFWTFVSGIAVGFSGAMKYNGALVILAPLTAILGRPRSRRIGTIVLLIPMVVGAFITVNPYVILDFSRFWEDFYSEIVHYSEGHLGYTSDMPPYRYYLDYLSYDLGSIPLLIILISSCTLVLGYLIQLALPVIESNLVCKRWVKAIGKYLTIEPSSLLASTPGCTVLLLLLFPAVYFLWLNSIKVLFVRNITCILPYLCIVAGLLFARLENFLNTLFYSKSAWKLIVVGLFLLTSISPLKIAWEYSFGLRQTMTYTLAVQWLESYAADLKAPINTVQFEWIPLPLSPKFQLKHLMLLPMNPDIFTYIDSRLELEPLEWYIGEDIQLVTVSDWFYSQHQELPEWDAYFKTILSHCRLLHTIPGRYKYFWKPVCGPAGCDVNPGPTIWIYSFDQNSVIP